MKSEIFYQSNIFIVLTGLAFIFGTYQIEYDVLPEKNTVVVALYNPTYYNP